MSLLKQYKLLNLETKTELIKTDKQLPESYKNIFLDVKNAILDMYEIKESVEISKGEVPGIGSEKYGRGIILCGESLAELLMDNFTEKAEKLTMIVLREGTLNQKTIITPSDVLKVLDKKMGSFLIRKLENVTKNGTNEVIMGYHKHHPELKIEIRIEEYSDENLLEPVISLYEFYCSGEEIYATNKALRAVKEKCIRINNLENPVNSLHVAELAQKRYDYVLDENEKQEVLNFIKYNVDTKESYEEGVLDWGMRRTEQRVTPEFCRKTKREIEKVKLGYEQKERYRLMAYDKENSLASFRQLLEREKSKKQNGWKDEIVTLSIPATKPLFTKSISKKGEMGVTKEDQELLRIKEEGFWKQKELKEMFGSDDGDIYTQLSNLELCLWEKMREMGYQNEYEENYKGETGYLTMIERITLDQIVHGFELNKYQSTNVNYNIAYRKDDVPNALKSKQIQIRVSPDMWRWHNKTSKQGKETNLSVMEYKFPKKEDGSILGRNNDDCWHRIEIRQTTKGISYDIENDYIYLLGERKEKLVEFIKKQLMDSKENEFLYHTKQIREQMKEETNRYVVMTEKQKKIFQTEMKKRWEEYNELPF